jgi:cysteine desulfurase
VVTSRVEHPAVKALCAQLANEGYRITELPVDSEGRLDMEQYRRSLTPDTAIVSLMWANNETGVIQPLCEAVDLARARGLPVHSDAIQAAGKIQLDVRELAVDLLSLSAHKYHGPKGVGALYVRRGLGFEPLLRGGGQEAGRRAGTENTAGIVGMGAAAACARRYFATPAQCPVSSLRDAFEAHVLTETSGVTVNGELAHRLLNTSHLSFDQCDAAGLLILLDEAGVAFSAGSG